MKVQEYYHQIIYLLEHIFIQNQIYLFNYIIKSLIIHPALSQYANDNKNTISELLLGFFNYYGNEFDYREEVISIKQLEPLEKLYKVTTCGWFLGNTLGIEDPFEDYYNVGHVLHGWNLIALKNQFLVY